MDLPYYIVKKEYQEKIGSPYINDSELSRLMASYGFEETRKMVLWDREINKWNHHISLKDIGYDVLEKIFRYQALNSGGWKIEKKYRKKKIENFKSLFSDILGKENVAIGALNHYTSVSSFDLVLYLGSFDIKNKHGSHNLKDIYFFINCTIHRDGRVEMESFRIARSTFTLNEKILNFAHPHVSHISAEGSYLCLGDSNFHIYGVPLEHSQETIDEFVLSLYAYLAIENTPGVYRSFDRLNLFTDKNFNPNESFYFSSLSRRLIADLLSNYLDLEILFFGKSITIRITPKDEDALNYIKQIAFDHFGNKALCLKNHKGEYVTIPNNNSLILSEKESKKHIEEAYPYPKPMFWFNNKLVKEKIVPDEFPLLEDNGKKFLHPNFLPSLTKFLKPKIYEQIKEDYNS